MKTFSPHAVTRQAFTLIEVLVSVLIMSGAIVYTMKIHSNTHEEILYISEKSKLALEDSLFLSTASLSYDKDEKSAYDVVERFFKIDDFDSREILKNISREFTIPEPIELKADEEEVPAAIVNEIKIKGNFSSSYFHFKLNAF